MVTYQYINIEKTTDKALLIKLVDNTTHWFPKKCCKLCEEFASIKIPEWLDKQIQSKKELKKYECVDELLILVYEAGYKLCATGKELNIPEMLIDISRVLNTLKN